MFIAHLESATCPLTIGLIDLPEDVTDGPFNALINTPAQTIPVH